MDKELQQGINTGFLPQEPRATDFIAGASPLSPVALFPSGDSSADLPSDEAQNAVFFDTMACVSFSALNMIETQLRAMLRQGLISKTTEDRMKELGYINAKGQINFSDRFTAKMSGTTRVGNYMTAVWDSIRKHGLLPESDWNFPREQRDPIFDWDDYYKEIPESLKAKALEFLKLFDVGYEWLVSGGQATTAQWREWLKYGPVQIATAICAPWSAEAVIPTCGAAVGHATLLYKVDDVFQIFDHYSGFRKRLALDYRIPYAMRGVVSAKVAADKPASVDSAFGMKLAGKLLLAVEDRGAVWYVTPTGKRAKIGTKSEEVEVFLQAIRDKLVPVVGITNKDLAKINPV